MFAALLAAVALVPAGFTENPVLNERATYVAGKDVRVYCAATDGAWSAYVSELPVAPPNGEADGYTPTIGGDETYLSPEVCAPMLLRIRHKRPSWIALGATVDVLTHESLHMRGISDEGATECAAYRALPSFLLAKWGFLKNGPRYLEVLRGARNYHQALPAEYHTVC